MRLNKVMVPIMLSAMLLTGCGPKKHGNGENANPEIAPGITQDDYDFDGYVNPEFKEVKPKGVYNISGCILDFYAGIWMRVGVPAIPNMSKQDGSKGDFRYIFKDTSVIKVETIEKNGVKSTQFVALKTGGTELYIYDGDIQIGRVIVNARVDLDNNELLFKKIGEADYWDSIYSTKANNSRLTLSKDEDGRYTKGSLTLVEDNKSEGTSEFNILMDERKGNIDLGAMMYYCYDVEVTKDFQTVKIYQVRVASSARMITIVDNSSTIGFYEPVYLN